jgi:hypothetical protein
MRILLFFSVILFILFSCRNGSQRPANILPEKEMESMMWDMLRGDQFVENFVVKPELFNEEGKAKDSGLKKLPESIKIYNEILAIHHVSKEQFRASLHYYQSDPLLMKPILAALADKQKEVMKDQLQKRKFMTDTSIRIIKPAVSR